MAVSNIAMVTITVSPASTFKFVSKPSKRTSKRFINALMATTTPAGALTQEMASQTVYKDAEDGSINGWLAYGEGTVTNVEEPSGNRIIKTEGDINGNPFRLGLADQSDWNNTKEFTALFRILMETDAAVYFRVETTEDVKYLCYRPGTADTVESIDNGFCFPLDIEADGR